MTLSTCAMHCCSEMPLFGVICIKTIRGKYMVNIFRQHSIVMKTRNSLQLPSICGSGSGQIMQEPPLLPFVASAVRVTCLVTWHKSNMKFQ